MHLAVLLSVHLSLPLSVSPSWMTLPLKLFKDFSYQPEMWWGDAQYHEANRYLIWPCSAKFCAFHGTLKFSMSGLDQVWRTILPLYLLKDFSYQPKIWWRDAQYHGAACYWKWSSSDHFCTFHRILKFSMIGLDQVCRKMTHIRKCEEITLRPEI